MRSLRECIPNREVQNQAFKPTANGRGGHSAQAEAAGRLVKLVHLLMVSATAGTSARRTMFSRPRYLMLGSRTLMNLPSIATPAQPPYSMLLNVQMSSSPVKEVARDGMYQRAEMADLACALRQRMPEAGLHHALRPVQCCYASGINT